MFIACLCIYTLIVHVCMYTWCMSMCVCESVCVCIDVLVFAGMTHVEVRRQFTGVIALKHVDLWD